MMIDVSFSNFYVYMLVLARMSGMIMFNPILSRRNIPAALKGGIALVLTFVTAGTMLGTNIQINSAIEFVYTALKELAVGWVYGFILQMFISVVLMAGEVMDMQMGLGMAKVYDPSSNVQMPLSGSLLNILFFLLFFLSDCHLTIIKMTILSFQIIPVGAGTFNFEIGSYIATLFSGILTLALKLALPVIAIEIITDASMGILMKAIPQINVFVLNIQTKVLVGMLVLFILTVPMASFIDAIISNSFTTMEQALKLLAAH
ncbi:flagellar biosynthetic protein FliR [Acetanaerobacterium elongatum]|nr:flagellar biosynthetic protein FliR [Acetanaerobacterium elongatum]